MIRAIVVDDERPARAKLRKLLADAPDVSVVAEAADGEQAVVAIVQHRPDLVFLDVRMPKLDGFGVIERVGLNAMPLVVFVTAFDDQALRAFEVHALDYLLKPFSSDRLLHSVGRARRRLRSEPSGAAAGRLGQLMEEVGPRHLRRIAVDKGPHRQLLLDVAEIRLIRAHKNYVDIMAGDAVYRRRGTLTALERRLDPDEFLRVNRSEIVRLSAVRETQPWFHGDYRLVLDDGQTLTWSRRYRNRQRGRFEPLG